MSFLRLFKKILDATFGPRMDRLYWKFRHVIDPTWAESYVSSQSLEHPHRKLLVETISRYTPFASLFEIGCASGPNLFLLSQKFPDTTLTGVDISTRAVEKGRAWFAEKGIKNASFSVGGFEHLSPIPDKSFDIVISDATLLYANPEQMKTIAADMARIARKAIILVEQHTGDKPFYNSHWIHNYKNIFPNAVFTKIPAELWAGDWGKYGYIIEVLCNQK